MTDKKPKREPCTLITFSDAGKHFCVTHTTVANWVDSGHLKASKMPGSYRRRIRWGEVQRLAAVMELSSSGAMTGKPTE